MAHKAVGLLSGGLDSTLAARLLLDQGIEIEALFLTLPWGCCERDTVLRMAHRLGIHLTVLGMQEDYLDVIKTPKYGRGAHMNPCVDCRIYMFHMAKRFMQETGAEFLFTGEVLGQRPMSQMRQSMRIIERDSGLVGYILRPLSAKLLEPTVPERDGVVDRERLLGLSGRSRKPQIELAAQYGITDYPTPAGGCLMTDPGFSDRVEDLMEHGELSMDGLAALKAGRQFRLTERVKLMIGRNEEDNRALRGFVDPADIILEPADSAGPYAILRGTVDGEALTLAAAITARYSKEKDAPSVRIHWRRGPEAEPQVIMVAPAAPEQADTLRI